ncbi:MAG: single-stranded DNA-binding protein [Bacilli bacterium]
MNSVCLCGRLTTTPELRYTQSNIAYSRFTIAVNRIAKEKATDFINCVAWNNQAENLCKFTEKGSLISIVGRLQSGSYDKPDGTKNYYMEVVANTINFLNTKKEENKQVEQSDESLNDEIDPFSDFGDSVSIEDNFLE